MIADNVFHIGRASSCGRVRELNEDSIGTPMVFHIGDHRKKERGVLVAVADGMGGHAAGEVASKTAVQALFEVYYDPRRANDPAKSLLDGFELANRQVLALSADDASKKHMGTTLVAAAVKDRALYIANVGDSRAYVARGDTIRQVTQDHSWAAEQVRNKIISEEQARGHIYRNILTRSVGNHLEVKPDLIRPSLKSGDVIILCSDGLSKKVQPEEILETVNSSAAPDAAAQQLVDLANERGGEDNVTVVVVLVPNLPPFWN